MDERDGFSWAFKTRFKIDGAGLLYPRSHSSDSKPRNKWPEVRKTCLFFGVRSQDLTFGECVPEPA
jgi:hypothetical protein